jgi:thymidylate synthase
MIVAVDSKNGISKGDELPWDTQQDQKFFKDITCRRKDSSIPQNVLIMGSRTYNCLPANQRPLVGRINLVLSRKVQPSSNGAVVFHNNIQDALKDPCCLGACNKGSTVFVVGGAEIYAAFLRDYAYLCDRIIMTKWADDYDCDTFFPDISGFALEEVLMANTRVFKRFGYVFPVDEKNRGLHPENAFLDLLEDIYQRGYIHGDKKVLQSQVLNFDLSDRFPLMTTKFTNFDHIKREVLWMLKGNTDTKLLEEHEIHHHIPTSSKKFLESKGLVWNEGDIGPCSGWQIRRFGAPYRGADGTERDGVVLDYYAPESDAAGIDQWEGLLCTIRDPSAVTQKIISFWNPTDVGSTSVAPHELTLQFHVSRVKDSADEILSATLVLRSCDVFSMGPWCIAYYALVVQLACFLTHMLPGQLNMFIGEAYLYQEHFDAVEKQMHRTPFPFPVLTYSNAEGISKIEDFLYEQLAVEGYEYWPPIRVKPKRG